MKKLSLLLLILFFISIQPLIAQSKNESKEWRYTASVELLGSLAGLKQTHHLGFGISGKAAYFIYRNFSFSLKTGYNYFPGSRVSSYSCLPLGATMTTKKGIPFTLIPVMAGINFYPVKWFYLSGAAGMVLGGSQGDFRTSFGYEPAIGFVISLGKNKLNLGMKFIQTKLNVTDAHAGQGCVIHGSDKASTLSLSVGYTF